MIYSCSLVPSSVLHQTTFFSCKTELYDGINSILTSVWPCHEVIEMCVCSAITKVLELMHFVLFLPFHRYLWLSGSTMASTDLLPIMLDHLYSMDDNLKVGRPLLSLEDARENPIIGDEPSPETSPIIEPTSISRCCIEKGLFPAVPLFFQYTCSISKGWSEWVDRKLLNPSICNIWRRAQVLDAIFLSKLWDIHIEAKMLCHVVRR